MRTNYSLIQAFLHFDLFHPPNIEEVIIFSLDDIKQGLIKASKEKDKVKVLKWKKAFFYLKPMLQIETTSSIIKGLNEESIFEIIINKWDDTIFFYTYAINLMDQFVLNKTLPIDKWYLDENQKEYFLLYYQNYVPESLVNLYKQYATELIKINNQVGLKIYALSHYYGVYPFKQNKKLAYYYFNDLIHLYQDVESAYYLAKMYYQDRLDFIDRSLAEIYFAYSLKQNYKKSEKLLKYVRKI